MRDMSTEPSKSKREPAIERFQRMAEPEQKLFTLGYRRIAGIDEAGRGPLAGPVYAAAVILDPKKSILGLNDSKRLSPKKRISLARTIKQEARAWALGAVAAAEIDQMGILPATRLAMERALANLPLAPDYLLFDYITGYHTDLPASFLKKGDALSNAIAAASILAKVARDDYMVKLDQKLPHYAFARHKGYGTALHYQALDQFGPCQEHRQSFLKTWREGKRHQ